MPELLEIETYRQAAMETVGRVVTEVDIIDPNYVKRVPPPALADVLLGARIETVRRIGKLLLVDLSNGSTVGMRFGMTGRLVVDGAAPIDRLVYGAASGDSKWDRFALGFDTGSLVIHDPRRLGGVELEPDEAALGPDAATVTTDQLVAALSGSRVALKSRLMDQTKIAGLGNLLTDEILWRVGLDPHRRCDDLDHADIDALRRAIANTVGQLGARGGSHTGDLQSQRDVGSNTAGYCPHDGEPLRRDRIGGRTTVWCAAHQC